eukprot:2882872-Pyramimonas_sp.AAC.1
MLRTLSLLPIRLRRVSWICAVMVISRRIREGVAIPLVLCKGGPPHPSPRSTVPCLAQSGKAPSFTVDYLN